MKFINTLLKITLLLFVITFLSCKDDSTNPSNTNNNNSSSGNNEWVPGTDLGNPLKPFKENSSTLINATVNKMIEYQNELYVGGDCDHAHTDDADDDVYCDVVGDAGGDDDDDDDEVDDRDVNYDDGGDAGDVAGDGY